MFYYPAPVACRVTQDTSDTPQNLRVKSASQKHQPSSQSSAGIKGTAKVSEVCKQDNIQTDCMS